jgi:predicted nucleic acid-binding protein
MRITDRDTIATRLVDEFGYSEKGALLAADRLVALTGSLAEQFAQWWWHGTSPNRSIEGYTFDSLIEGSGMNPIAAFLTLDWLERDPQRASASLHRGRDRIATSSEKAASKRRPEVYLDSNVVLELAHGTLPLPERLAIESIIDKAREGEVRIRIPKAIMAELSQLISRSSIAALVGSLQALGSRQIVASSAESEWAPETDVQLFSELTGLAAIDPREIEQIAEAIGAGADFFLTMDRDLIRALGGHVASEYGIQTLVPSEFKAAA